jgi:transmembrane sensor
MAATAAAALIVTLSWAAFVRNPGETFHTDVAERQVAVLDDGSRLTLDADSRVKVRMESEQRELSLERGRAKFDVAYDPLRPFVVSIGERKVIATGTAFSVERLGANIRIVLYEGRVAIVAPGLAAVPTELRTPGTALVLPFAGSGSAERDVVDTGRSVGWERGQLDFEREPLSRAVERMNRYARTPIEVVGTGARDVQITGVFDAGETEAFVEGVSAVHGLKVRREQDRIVLEQP